MHLVEVGPRDGLQNEDAPVPTDVKVAFVDRLSASGLPEIEVTSFVSPRAIPQLADGDELFRKIARKPGTLYSALVPNERGLDRALAARVDRVNLFTAATESFNQKNIGTSIEGSLERFRPVAARSAEAKLPLRAYVSTAFGCPFEGAVDPAAVLDVSLRLLDLGVGELSISDTIGVATPGQVRRVLETLLPRMPVETIALHFHATRGMAEANIYAGLEYGVSVFDASAGGLGGCPYAPGASGNVATEDVLYLLRGLGIETGVTERMVTEASDLVAASLGIQLPARNRWSAGTDRYFS